MVLFGVQYLQWPLEKLLRVHIVSLGFSQHGCLFIHWASRFHGWLSNNNQLFTGWCSCGSVSVIGRKWNMKQMNKQWSLSLSSLAVMVDFVQLPTTMEAMIWLKGRQAVKKTYVWYICVWYYWVPTTNGTFLRFDEPKSQNVKHRWRKQQVSVIHCRLWKDPTVSSVAKSNFSICILLLLTRERQQRIQVAYFSFKRWSRCREAVVEILLQRPLVN